MSARPGDKDRRRTPSSSSSTSASSVNGPGTVGIQVGPDGIEPAVNLGGGLAMSPSGDLSVGSVQVSPEPTNNC